jgi:hypothetical protein
MNLFWHEGKLINNFILHPLSFHLYHTILFKTPVKVSSTSPAIVKFSFNDGKLLRYSTSATTVFSGLDDQSAGCPRQKCAVLTQ